MSFELNNLSEWEELNLFSDNFRWDFSNSNDWVEEALKSSKILGPVEKSYDELMNNFFPLDAVDESEQSFVLDLESYVSKEAQSSGQGSQMIDETQYKGRITTKCTFEELAQYVKQEIARIGYESVLNFCLMKDEEKEKEKKVNMRNHNNKNKIQIEKLNQALKQFPKQFPIKERRKLAKEIGLSEEQIYRWYYEHNPDIKRNKPKSTSKSVLLLNHRLT